jgi:hypothetical protein
MLTKSIITTMAAATMLAASMTASHAAASDLDDCILDMTFQCLDAADFWDCYDTGVEFCENQSSAEIAVMPKSRLASIKSGARQKAQITLQQHLLKTTR